MVEQDDEVIRFTLKAMALAARNLIRQNRAKKEDFNSFEEFRLKGGFSYEELETSKDEIDHFMLLCKEKVTQELNRYLERMQKKYLDDFPLDEYFEKTIGNSLFTYKELKMTEREVRLIFKQYYKTHATQCLQALQDNYDNFLYWESQLRKFLAKAEIELGDLDTGRPEVIESELAGYLKFRCVGRKAFLEGRLEVCDPTIIDCRGWEEELKAINKRLKELMKD